MVRRIEELDSKITENAVEVLKSARSIEMQLVLYEERYNAVAPPYLVDAQRAPFRSRTTGFLGIDVLFSSFVRGRPFS